MDDLTIDGHAVITNGVFAVTSFTTALGSTLSVTAFNAATGQVSYSYTLVDNQTHPAGLAENTLFEDLAVVLTDVDGSSANGTLSVGIVDDVASAVLDVDSVTEDGPLAATGNVVTGTYSNATLVTANDANATDGAADTLGADGFGSVAWTGAVAGVVAGTFGSLSVDAAGNYVYNLDNTNATVQGLSAGETLTDQFTYTVTDGDGDTSQTTLTITINGANDGVTITNLTPSASGGDAIVDEDDLLAARGPGESAGSDPTKESLTATGTFNISAPDGVDDLTIDGNAVITNGVFAVTSFTTALGSTLSVTAFNAATGQVSYSYTLVDNQTHPAGLAENTLFEDLAVVLTDVDGSSANGTLSVGIVDDVASAVLDVDSVTEDGPLAATGNVVTGTYSNATLGTANDANATDGAADTLGADGFGSVAWTGAVAGVVAGTFGSLSVDAAGNYVYNLDNTNATVQGLSAGETLTDQFTYTVTDGDGDTSHDDVDDHDQRGERRCYDHEPDAFCVRVAMRLLTRTICWRRAGQASRRAPTRRRSR